MSRIIDADALKETIVVNVYPVRDDFNSNDYGMFWTGGIEKAIDEQPTIDAVEVVRCKNCKYWREGSGIFDFSPYCELTATKCDGEHFCSWGEKSVLRNQRDLVNGLWTGGERLVRCRDCRYYGHECVLLFPEDGYCYDGKRREDG